MFVYQEELISQIPAVRLLVALGYHYLTPAEALALRGGRERNVVLTEVTAAWLCEHNRFSYGEQTFPFNNQAIAEAVRRLTELNLNEGVVRCNEGVTELLSLGFSYPQIVNGDTRHYSLSYVDWLHPENNVYHVTEEFSVEREGSHQTRRPDIVCFVNGIPFAVIECKRPDLQTAEGGLPHEEAISQTLRNQLPGEIRPLFAYAQLLMALSTNHAAYAVTGTPKKFWAAWKEEDADAHEARAAGCANQPLPPEVEAVFYDWREHSDWVREHFQNQPSRLPTEQDRAILSLLDPVRMLELAYQFMVFDSGVKKVARYQQYFAVKATIDRVAALNAQGSRTGGVIWHTTGSGKSLTMVMLTKALVLHPNIPNPRVILVTDRINLDEQIYGTFHKCGKEIVQATSGKHLIELIRGGKADIIATVIDKFEAAAAEKVVDSNPNIFVLVDESHRSQYGAIHAKMRQVFPDACYIGFTGTPLTQGEKDTARQFGSFIHKYPMRQAVADKTVVPLLYEGRMVELEPNQAQLDRWFERHTQGLSDEQKADLKRKMSREDVVSDADRRIQEIAYNLSEHFAHNFKDRHSGFKAQLATSSKAVALRYKKYLDEAGQITSEVVISSPDTREGHEDVEGTSIPEVQQFWNRMMQRFGKEEIYNREVIADFARADGVDLLIVVDKLLVGFDEPRNTVLYVDKPLKDHAILQAIARVNRLFEGKEFGYIIDYRGILGELDEAIQTYDALADFNSEDVADTIADVSAEIAKLPQRHSDLWAVFNGVDIQDSEAIERFLQPEDRRQVFYDALVTYARTLKVALTSVVFYENTPDERIATYKRDLKFFHNLRASVQFRYAETVDFRDYEQKIRKLLDTHIDARGVKQLTPDVEIFNVEAFNQLVEGMGTPRAKAEAILNHLKRTVLEKMETDPAYYRKFSQMIDDTLAAIEQQRISEVEGLERANNLKEQEISGQRRDIPEQLHHLRDAPAYYGVVRETLNRRLADGILADMAAQIERLIEIKKIRDWGDNSDVLNQMRNAIEDYLYQIERENSIRFTGPEIDEIIEQVISIARKRI
jgi:type I restriction enzyme R subunit